MIYNFIKDTMQIIKDGKTVIVKELSQMVNTKDEMNEEVDLPEENEGTITVDSSSKTEQEDEEMEELLKSSKTEKQLEQVVTINKEEVKDVEEIQEDLANNKLVVEDVWEVNKVIEKEDVQEETSSKMEDEVHAKHTNRNTELSQAQDVKKEAESKINSTFSYLKHLPN